MSVSRNAWKICTGRKPVMQNRRKKDSVLPWSSPRMTVLHALPATT